MKSSTRLFSCRAVFVLLMLGVLALGVAAQQTFTSTAAPIPQTPANRAARKLVDQAIQALGGKAFLQYRYKTSVGRAFGFENGGNVSNIGVPVYIYSRYPDARRIELTKRRDVIDFFLIRGGKASGWETTYRGTEPLKAKQVALWQDVHDHSLPVILRDWVKAPGTLMIEQAPQHEGVTQMLQEVYIGTNDGHDATIDFAQDTHLPVKISWRRVDPDGDGYLRETESFEDYQVFGGINTPMSVERRENGVRVAQTFLSSVNYQAQPDTLFVQPTPSTKAAPHKQHKKFHHA